jgi:hypothetical protein
VVDRRHNAHAHQRLDDFTGLHRHTLRQVADSDRFGHLHFALDELGRTLEFAALFVDLSFRTTQIGLQRDLAAATLFAVAEFVVYRRYGAATVLVSAAIFGSALWRTGFLFGGLCLRNSLRRLAFEARFVGLFDLRRCLRGLCFFLLALDLRASTLVFRFLLGFEPSRLFFRRFARRVFTSDPLSFYFRLGSDGPSLLRSFRNRPLA